MVKYIKACIIIFCSNNSIEFYTHQCFTTILLPHYIINTHRHINDHLLGKVQFVYSKALVRHVIVTYLYSNYFPLTSNHDYFILISKH